MPSGDWWLYMIECKGGGIYVGIALDVERRYQQHEKGRGSIYTKINKPKRLLAKMCVGSHQDAIRMEREIKQLSPTEKMGWVRALCGTSTSNFS